MKGNSSFNWFFNSLLFIFFTAIPCWAQNEKPGDETTPGVSAEHLYYQEGELAQLWETFSVFSKEGDPVASEQIFEEIREIRRKEGNPIMEPLGFLFLQKAREESSLDSFQQARQDYLHAIQMNPHLWSAYANLGNLKMREGKGWKTFVSMYIKGLTLAFDSNNVFFLMKTFDWLVGNLIWVVFMSSSLFFLIISIKYLRPHLYVFFVDKNPTLMKPALAAAILFFPLLLGLDFYLLSGAYLIMFFPFFTASERKNVIFVSLILVVLPFLLGLQAALKSLQTDPEFKFQNKQFYLGDPSRQVEELSKLLEQSPNDEYYFSLGVLQQKLGDYQAAIENYQKISSQSRYWAYGMVNEGGIFFLGQKYQDAISNFEKATQKNPDLVEAHFNLSSALGLSGKHLEAEKSLLKAKALDPLFVENCLMLGKTMSTVEMVRTEGFIPLLIRIKVEFQNVFKLTPPFILPWIYFIILILVSFLHSRIRNPRLLPQTCTKCGKIYYPSESPNSEWCSQCVHIYLLKSDLPSEAKIMKHDEVKKFNTRRNRIGFWTHVFLPGARAILSNAGKTGWFSLFFWILLLRFSWTSISDISYPGMSYMAGKDLILYFTWGTTFVFWLIFGFRAAWQED